jgi:nitronate monooxygenase
LLELFQIELPILLAPMAGPSTAELAVAVCEAGGLGSLACALSTAEQVRTALGAIRQRTAKPLNLNFFTHEMPKPDPDREAGWRARLRPYYAELGLDPDRIPSSNRAPFDDESCAIVEEFKPKVVSFHFGLPEGRLLDRGDRV